MKRLWLSLAVIAALAAAALFNVWYLSSFTGSLTSVLSQAQNLAEDGETDAALSLTEKALADFDSHSFYFHVTLSHQSLDNIESAFSEVVQYLRAGETGAVYAAANSRLLAQLLLLAESEQLTLKNLL